MGETPIRGARALRDAADQRAHAALDRDSAVGAAHLRPVGSWRMLKRFRWKARDRPIHCGRGKAQRIRKQHRAPEGGDRRGDAVQRRQLVRDEESA
jgi:hypothetical protein